MNGAYLKSSLCRSTFVLPFILLSLIFSGCSKMAGYSNDSLFPQDITSVYVEMFDSQSFWRGAEYTVSDALAKRIEADTPYKIVSSRDRADTVVSGKIISIIEGVLTAERELGGVLEKELVIRSRVNWKNLKTGELIIEDEEVLASASYSGYQNQNFLYASTVAANNLARKIVELMETKWE